MLSFFSSRRNWGSTNPLAAGECAPHPLVRGGGGVGHTRLRERGWGSRNPTRGHTLWCDIYAYKYFVKVLHGRLLENLVNISTRRKSKSNKFNTIAFLKNLPHTNVPRCTSEVYKSENSATSHRKKTQIFCYFAGEKLCVSILTISEILSFLAEKILSCRGMSDSPIIAKVR